jgi:hypothetical protein
MKLITSATTTNHKEVAIPPNSLRHSSPSTTANPNTTAPTYTTRWDVTRGDGLADVVPPALVIDMNLGR